MLLKALFLLFCSFAIAFAITPGIRFLAMRRGLMDHPTERSSHVVPTPRGGGLAIVSTHLAALLALKIAGFLSIRELMALEIGGVAVALVGFADDRKSVPPVVRFSVHLAAAIFVVAMIGGIPFSELFGSNIQSLDKIVGVLGIAWAINLFNFMDGIDGIAGAETIFISASAAVMIFVLGGSAGVIAALGCLSMASLGFLIWNWPPAKIFMGDIGSGFVGFMLAALSILISHRMAFPVQVWPILGGVFLIDATVTLVRRMLRGDRWHQAHRTHAYQHLAQIWRKHLPVTLFVCALNIFWLLPWAWFAAAHQEFATAAAAIALLPLLWGVLWADAGKPTSQLHNRP
jgi:Fuc2NAc and GlcNAc transferase